MWISYTSYQLIHKEKVAFELLLKSLNHTKFEKGLALEKKYLKQISVFGSFQVLFFSLHFIPDTYLFFPCQ